MVYPIGPKHMHRRFVRRNLSSRAVIFHGDHTYIGKTMQVSQGGLLISCPERLLIGIKVMIHFVLENDYIRAQAEVIYVNKSSVEPGQYGVGLKFTAIAEVQKDLIRIYTGDIKKP
jgi:hypothetical protein